MKKIISLFLCVAMVIPIAACYSAPTVGSASSSSSVAVTSVPSSSSGTSSSAVDSSNVSSTQGLDVQKGLLDVTITFPAEWMKDAKDADFADAKKEGIQVTKSKDGSVTYKMSKAQHKKLMEEMKKSTSDSLKKIKTDGNFTSVTDVRFDDDFSQVSILVDNSKYENSLDSFASLSAGFQCMFYQIFDGKDEKTTSVKVDFIDNKTNKVIDSATYPDALNESSSNSSKK